MDDAGVLSFTEGSKIFYGIDPNQTFTSPEQFGGRIGAQSQENFAQLFDSIANNDGDAGVSLKDLTQAAKDGLIAVDANGITHVTNLGKLFAENQQADGSIDYPTLQAAFEPPISEEMSRSILFNVFDNKTANTHPEGIKALADIGFLNIDDNGKINLTVPGQLFFGSDINGGMADGSLDAVEAYNIFEGLVPETATQAAQVIKDNFALFDTAAGLGEADNLLERADLEAVMNSESAPEHLREAARIMLESQNFDGADNAYQSGALDGKISSGDLEAFIGLEAGESQSQKITKLIGGEDGKISPQELYAAFSNKLIQFSENGKFELTGMGQAFLKFDGDFNGEITNVRQEATPSEFDNALAADTASALTTAQKDFLFELITGGNGQITPEKLLAAEQRGLIEFSDDGAIELTGAGKAFVINDITQSGALSLDGEFNKALTPDSQPHTQFIFDVLGGGENLSLDQLVQAEKSNLIEIHEDGSISLSNTSKLFAQIGEGGETVIDQSTFTAQFSEADAEYANFLYQSFSGADGQEGLSIYEMSNAVTAGEFSVDDSGTINVSNTTKELLDLILNEDKTAVSPENAQEAIDNHLLAIDPNTNTYVLTDIGIIFAHADGDNTGALTIDELIPQLTPESQENAQYIFDVVSNLYGDSDLTSQDLYEAILEGYITVDLEGNISLTENANFLAKTDTNADGLLNLDEFTATLPEEQRQYAEHYYNLLIENSSDTDGLSPAGLTLAANIIFGEEPAFNIAYEAGTISLNEVAIEATQVNAAFSNFDTDATPGLSETEFGQAFLPDQVGQGYFFNLIAGEDGQIDKAELTFYQQAGLIEVNDQGQISVTDFGALVVEHDADQSGTLNDEEIRSMLPVNEEGPFSQRAYNSLIERLNYFSGETGEINLGVIGKFIAEDELQVVNGQLSIVFDAEHYENFFENPSQEQVDFFATNYPSPEALDNAFENGFIEQGETGFTLSVVGETFVNHANENGDLTLDGLKAALGADSEFADYIFRMSSDDNSTVNPELFSGLLQRGLIEYDDQGNLSVSNTGKALSKNDTQTTPNQDGARTLSMVEFRAAMASSGLTADQADGLFKIISGLDKDTELPDGVDSSILEEFDSSSVSFVDLQAAEANGLIKINDDGSISIPEDVKPLQPELGVFGKNDYDQNGTISRNELRNSLTDDSILYFDYLFQVASENGEELEFGSLSTLEALGLIKINSNGSISITDIGKVYAKHDTDKSGYLSGPEWNNATSGVLNETAQDFYDETYQFYTDSGEQFYGLPAFLLAGRLGENEGDLTINQDKFEIIAPPPSDDGCFLAGTPITMADGSTKPIEEINLKDEIALGGFVYAVGKFLVNNLYEYKGIKVSGTHMVQENGQWIRVQESEHSKSLGSEEQVVYVFGCQNRKLLINDTVFTDYFDGFEQEGLKKLGEQYFNEYLEHEMNAKEFYEKIAKASS